MYVTSNPSSAYIYVDNVYKGLTPKNITNITSGNHTIKLAKSGYNPYTTIRNIPPWGDSLSVTLTPSTNLTNQTGGAFFAEKPVGINYLVISIVVVVIAAIIIFMVLFLSFKKR